VADGGDNNQGDNNQGDNNQGNNDQGSRGAGGGTATPELDSGTLTALGVAAAVVLLGYRRRRGSARRTGEQPEV
jgi:hypothetical protein